MINLKTKKLTQDGNSLLISMSTTILFLRKKVSPRWITSSPILSKVLSYTMVLLILDIISATSRKNKMYGSSSMMKELGNLIPVILR